MSAPTLQQALVRLEQYEACLTAAGDGPNKVVILDAGDYRSVLAAVRAASVAAPKSSDFEELKLAVRSTVYHWKDRAGDTEWYRALCAALVRAEGMAS